MTAKALVETWFARWSSGDYHDLPLADDFRHTSPFGTIEGREAYLALVEANKEKFLGYRFEIHDALYEAEQACVRYTAIQGDFKLDVSEWYYVAGEAISEIVSYYHIGEIREERQLENVS
jgi:hypothetical protein